MAANNYVLGKGRIYFDRFLPNTKTPTGNFRYLGNTPGFTISQDSETLDHFSSEGGIRVKDDSVTLEQNMSGTLSCDNISADNMALWFGGTAQPETQASGSSLTYAIPTARKGYTYFIGATAADPMGDMNLSSLTVTQGGSPVAASGNYEVDLKTGKLDILDNAVNITEGSALTVTYGLAAGTRTIVIENGESIYGSLRFMADNPKGINRHAILPYVGLTSNGDFAFKGEEWMQMQFNLEVLQLNSTTRRILLPTS